MRKKKEKRQTLRSWKGGNSSVVRDIELYRSRIATVTPPSCCDPVGVYLYYRSHEEGKLGYREGGKQRQGKETNEFREVCSSGIVLKT